MIWFLRIFFIVVLVSMLGVTGWASSRVALWETPREVATHPWFIATLFDTYWAFFTFYLWLAYKEASFGRRLAWFVGIVLLGNIAMAVYMLWQLFRLPASASLEELLLRHPKRTT
jgi:hypothetical protein